MPIERDDQGRLILTAADVPNAGVVKKTITRSGNPAHDVHSGKFGSTNGGSAPAKPKAPANVDPVEFARYLDAVRDAARRFDVAGEDEIRDFLAGRARDPEAVDIAAFIKAVEAQQEADLVDILYAQLGATGAGKVKLQAPRTTVKRAMTGLDPEKFARIAHRLIARGVPQVKVDRVIAKYTADEATRTQVKEQRDAIQLSEQWQFDEIVEMVDTPAQPESPDMAEFAETFTKAIAAMPQPVINVEVPIHMPKGGSRRVIRDDKGLVTEVVEEP